MTQKTDKQNTNLHPISEMLKKTERIIHKRYINDNGVNGTPTGFTEFDTTTGGLQPGNLIVVAGYSYAGKSAFATNIALNVAIDEGVGVVVFDMTISAEFLTMRMLSCIGKINLTRLRTGQLDEYEDWPRLESAVNILNETSIFIDDSPVLSLTDISNRIQNLKQKYNIGLVVVDYLQLIQIKNYSENRFHEISEISHGLKILAKEMNIPVIVLAQLPPNLEQPSKKCPVMSDLVKLGTIEAIADLVVFIHDDNLDKDTTEIIIGKHRNGYLGTTKLRFQEEYMTFSNHSYNEYD